MSARSRTRRAYRPRRRRRQWGGFLPGLIAQAIIAKKRGKNANKAMKNYVNRSIGRRIAVGKKYLSKEVPTPGNTGMSTKDFFMSGLFGMG